MPRWTRKAWFGPAPPGRLFPMPASWEGWALFAALLVAIAATVRLTGEVAWLARMAILVVFGAVAWLTYDPEA
jgi:uncharacterized membrane protein